MPVYQAPGVYVEEVAGTPPILGVGTNTAGFIGVGITSQDDMPLMPGVDKDNATTTDHYPVAPENEAILVTNWEQFKAKFGVLKAANKTLAHAVYGFFLNGGTRCWVARVGALANAGDVTTALKNFERIDEIALLAIPGAINDGIQTAAIDHCKKLKDRFAIIDGLATLDSNGNVNPTNVTVSDIKYSLGDTSYAAIYFPRIEVYDPVSDARDHVYSSGHMAGIYSRVDQQRGVHKAPANEVVMGALGLEYQTTRNEQAGLNPEGINVIRNFNGTIRVWGARTLGGKNNGEYIHINTRRLINFIRESIEEGTQVFVFEPHNQALWQKITRSVTAFLTNVWRDGALFGSTPEEAFYVKCDETTNPPEVRDLGQVITEIGVAVVKPAEFVIFRIQQISGPASQ
jgi:hypothetical protein